MKIMLVNPQLSGKFPNGRDLIHEADLVHIPMGLLHLAAVAEAEGHRARVVDMPIAEMSIEEYQRILDEERPDVVAITTMTATYPNAIECGRRAKDLGSFVVMGGPHVSFDDQSAIKAGACDLVIRGEGEIGFQALLRCLEDGCSLSQIPGGSYLEEAQFVRRPQAPRIRNIDSLPEINYDLVDMKKYVEIEALGVHSSRGCPYTCEFCTIQGQWGRAVTFRSPSAVADELAHLIDKFDYQGKEFIFYDDTFTVNRTHVIQICKEIIKRDVSVRWHAMTRVDRVDPELLAEMKRAGCFSITYGIESTEEESLKQMGKGQHFDQVIKSISMAKELGLRVMGYFIIGFPWETREDMFNVVRKMGDLGLDRYGLAMLAPYPGTPYYDQADRWKITIPDPDWERFNHLLPVIETPNFNLRDQAEAFLEFLCEHVIE